MIDDLAQLYLDLYLGIDIIQAFLTLVGAPALLIFVFQRRSQLRDPHNDLRITTSAYTALHFFCASIFGLLLPTLYLCYARNEGISTKVFQSYFDLIVYYPTPWPALHRLDFLVALGAMTWLSAHLLEAVVRWDRPRFAPHWLNRLCSGGGLLFFLLLLARTIWAFRTGGDDFSAFTLKTPPGVGLWYVIWRTTCILVGPSILLGAVIIYGFAFAESKNKNAAKAPPKKRRWHLALAIQSMILLMFASPFWLSIPRVTHRQALGLLETHQASIIEIAQRAELDPALLAGIIYVVQTRDHPRWTGDIHEQFCLSLWKDTATPGVGILLSNSFRNRFNASAGLCQVRPGTAEQVLVLLNNKKINLNSILIATHNRLPPPEPSRPIYSDFIRFQHDLEYNDSINLLLNPRNNLIAAATILSVLDEDWQEAGFPLLDQPEILATLYNLGFGKSHPKADPEPNDFGERVANFMATEYCQRLFKVDTLELKADNKH